MVCVLKIFSYSNTSLLCTDGIRYYIYLYYYIAHSTSSSLSAEWIWFHSTLKYWYQPESEKLQFVTSSPLIYSSENTHQFVSICLMLIIAVCTVIRNEENQNDQLIYIPFTIETLCVRKTYIRVHLTMHMQKRWQSSIHINGQLTGENEKLTSQLLILNLLVNFENFIVNTIFFASKYHNDVLVYPPSEFGRFFHNLTNQIRWDTWLLG